MYLFLLTLVTCWPISQLPVMLKRIHWKMNVYHLCGLSADSNMISYFVSPEGGRKLSGTWHSDLDQWAVICKLMILIRVEDLSLISCVVLCGMSWPGRQTGCVMQSPEASPHSLPPILPNSVQVSGSHQQQDAADRECCKIYFLLLRASPTNKPSIELGVQCWMSYLSSWLACFHFLYFVFFVSQLLS